MVVQGSDRDIMDFPVEPLDLFTVAKHLYFKLTCYTHNYHVSVTCRANELIHVHFAYVVIDGAALEQALYFFRN